MSDFSNDELFSYCMAQSRTSVGMIHKTTMKRLIELAGECSDGVERYEFWNPDSAWIDRLVVCARQKVDSNERM